MSIVAFAGDACTTTALAVASAWPIASDVLLIEADPSGGDLAAWLDISVEPSLSTAVTSVRAATVDEAIGMARITPSGFRLIPAPPRPGEARQAVAGSARALAPALAGAGSTVAIVDTGDLESATPNPLLAMATLTVVVHRQSTQSARAAAVRLQRLVGALHDFGSGTTGVVVAVVGGSPYALREIEALVAGSVGPLATAELPVDALSAAVLAGRTGVSVCRFSRLPLARAARSLAVSINDHLEREASPW